MRLFKTKWFMRYAKQERIGDHSLCDAIVRAERGLVDADLREIGAAWLEANKKDLERAINEGLIIEVSYDDKE